MRLKGACEARTPSQFHCRIRSSIPPLPTAILNATMMQIRVYTALLVAACLLPFACAQWGRGGGDPRGYGGGGGGYGGGGGGGYGGGGQKRAPAPAANAVARPGGDSSLDDSVRLFLQLDQDGITSISRLHDCACKNICSWHVLSHTHVEHRTFSIHL